MLDGKSVVLIGMPGAGKSTIGVMLAKELAKDFIDTDILIQSRENATLQDIMDAGGYLHLRDIEADVIQNAHYHNHVIATGGSAVYSDAAMKHLATLGPIVYLEASLDELRRRIHNYESRGIARREDQSFEDVFAERTELYRRYADITIDGDGSSQGAVLKNTVEKLLAL
ncbi:homoserine kinase [Pseudoteredinibacter isoporae]